MAPATAILLVASLATSVAAAPHIIAREPDMCDAGATSKGKSYLVNNNLWNSKDKDGNPKKGSQCITAGENTDKDVSWSTTWQWSPTDDQVISFANSEAVLPAKKPVNDILTFKTHAEWSYDADPVKADVAIDVFTHSNTTVGCGVQTDYEIMLWLNRYGPPTELHPKGAVVEESTTIADIEWEVWFGDGKDGGAGSQPAYSFLAKKPQPKFDGDVKEFIDHLTKLEKNPLPTDNQNLVCAQFGTEAWKADKKVTFNTKSFSAAVEYR